MANPRPRRDVQRPRYLDDFLVTLPPRHLPSRTLYDHSTVGAATQSPLPVISSPPVRPAPQNLSSDAVMSVLQEIKEENNQLRRDMQSLFNSLSMRSTTQPQRLTSRHAAQFEDSGASYVPYYPPERTSTPNCSLRAPVDDLPPWPDAVPILPSAEPLPPPPPPPVDEPLPPPPPPVSYFPSYDAGLQTTPEYVEPYTLPHEPPSVEATYRGPKPHIPLFTDDDPRQFAQLKIALDNILPRDATERFKFQILVDHLKPTPIAIVQLLIRRQWRH